MALIMLIMLVVTSTMMMVLIMVETMMGDYEGYSRRYCTKNGRCCLVMIGKPMVVTCCNNNGVVIRVVRPESRYQEYLKQ